MKRRQGKPIAHDELWKLDVASVAKTAGITLEDAEVRILRDIGGEANKTKYLDAVNASVVYWGSYDAIPFGPLGD